jgi:hypothetical protein
MCMATLCVDHVRNITQCAESLYLIIIMSENTNIYFYTRKYTIMVPTSNAKVEIAFQK